MSDKPTHSSSATTSYNATTHFGYETIPTAEKEKRVGDVFRSVAARYDIMNDIMSFGAHRLMKRITIEYSGLKAGHTVLDLAGGTGDFSLRFSPIVGEKGLVVLADINDAMLAVGRDRIIDKGSNQNIFIAQVNVESLPFRDKSFDCVCIAYGLRNVTDKFSALKSMYRVLKPGGRVLILEFSKPKNKFVKKTYRAFAALWPFAGKVVADDSESYRYLVESIRMHPDQETLKTILEDANFKECKYYNLLNGICAIHIGFKPLF
jgi:demethylmenaquinone methyltransferase/2-methoxy-6-polyprenyl-1,4-benzoquinol methylase